MIIITSDLVKVLDEIGDDIAIAIYNLDSNGNVSNPMNVSKLDISDKDWMMDVTIGKNTSGVKIGSLIKGFFPNKFSQVEIYDFSKKYNRLLSELFGWGSQKGGYYTSTPISVVAKKADYRNIRETFLSLVTETYPHGHEEEVMHLMPTSELTKDKFGNYYKIVGKSSTLFTSHIDTASYKKSAVNLFSYKEGNDEIICTDGTSILGADDKAGVAIMLYMMEHNIPGIYYFFIGEERGCIGSSAVVSELETFSHLSNVSRVIAFDRRNYNSVITVQMGGRCCSDEFGKALSAELNKSGLKMNLDPTGIYTDSACFMDDMPEITNVSVGYFNEHTGQEIQNITFLEKLAKACIAVNWESLPVRRRVGISPEMMKKFKAVINDAKKFAMDAENATKVVGEGDVIVIRLESSEPDFDKFYKDITGIYDLMNKYNLDPDVTFDENKVKIKIK